MSRNGNDQLTTVEAAVEINQALRDFQSVIITRFAKRVYDILKEKRDHYTIVNIPLTIKDYEAAVEQAKEDMDNLACQMVMYQMDGE